MRKITIFVVLLASVHVANAALERVLLPLYAAQPVRGAYGAMWQSELVMHNGSAILSFMIPTCLGGCPTGPLTEDEELVPGETQQGLPQLYPLPANPVAGTVVWLYPENSQGSVLGDVTFDLRVVDRSRSATAAGTEVPVVHESGLHADTVHLLNVPVDSRFRLNLRLFELNLATAQFTIRIFDQATDALVSTKNVTTATGGVAPGGFTPGFAELDNIAQPPVTRVRVEISPNTSGVAFWAYVSITNDDSQQITLVTPQ